MAAISSKPMCEKIIPTNDSAWRYWLYEVTSLDFHWHYHPEYEICLTLDSFGERYVGDNIEPYRDLDLVLLGPNLPHAWISDASLRGQEQQVYVAQLPVDWLNYMIDKNPEMVALKDILAGSIRGIAFSESVAVKAKQLFVQMHDADSFSRLVMLFHLFELMIRDKHARLLSSEHFELVQNENSSIDKIDKVITYIRQHYTEALCADDMAKLAHMSTNHFHRFFKKRTEQTFIELVNQLRIGKACSLLINSHLPVGNISDACGFNNTSNFNRRFLKHKGCTPRQFRKAYRNSEHIN